MAEKAHLKAWVAISVFLAVLGASTTVAGRTAFADDGRADFNGIQAGERCKR